METDKNKKRYPQKENIDKYLFYIPHETTQNLSRQKIRKFFTFSEAACRETTRNPINQKNYKIGLLKLTTWLVFFLTLIPAGLVDGRTFDPNNILTDEEMFSGEALSQAAIQVFLDREGSALRNFSENVAGQTKSAAQIIYENGAAQGVSQKFLLATLEKEKGLISKSAAAQKDFDWATGYSCFGGNCKEKYRGFFNQVESTAITQNIYKQKAGQFSFRVGQTTKTFDHYGVMPKNQATANLYVYTPYVGNAPELGIISKFGANHLFWQIWNLYFTDRILPDGLVMKYGGDYYLIEKNKKRKFGSQAIYLADHKNSEAILVDLQTFNAYETGAEVSFANNTLVRSSTTGQAFLILDGTARPIIDDAALALISDFRLALNSVGEIALAENEKITNYPIGVPIAGITVYPQGKFFRVETGEIYFVQDGLKHLVDAAVWQANYGGQMTEPATLSGLDSYPTGTPLLFKDGAFIKNSAGTYYLISNGEKLKIAELEIGKKVFGADKFYAAVLASDTILELHASGLNIDYADDTIVEATAPAVQPAAAVAAPVENYQAIFVGVSPESIILVTGELKNLTITFKNIGATSWVKDRVWLEADGMEGKFYFSEGSVSQGQEATFNVDYRAGGKVGLQQQNFSLVYLKDGVKQNLGTIGKFILIKAGTTSEILSHNLPVAVRNNWKPIQITMKIKNTSTDEIWLSRKTALEIYNSDFAASPFYDKNDWVREEVAAVPINKTKILPGETGEFQFTLKVKGLAPGTYILKFSLKLLDKEKDVLLDGLEVWEKQIRVDG